MNDPDQVAPPLLSHLIAGPESITWKRRLPTKLEGVSETLARIERPPNWFELDIERVRELAWVAVTAFDGDGYDRVSEITGPVYMAYRDLASPNHRAFFIDELARKVADDSCKPDSLGALVWVEDEPLLIARAAAAYCDARGMAERDPVPAAEELLSGWRESGSKQRAGIFLGLLLVGDSGILDGLRECRYELTDEEVWMICEATICGVYDTTAEFMVEWLEEVQAERDHSKFVMLAAFIIQAGPDRREDGGKPDAADWRRLTPPGSDYEIPDDWCFAFDWHNTGRRLGPRLRALARRESATRLMPALFAAYGIEGEEEAS